EKTFSDFANKIRKTKKVPSTRMTANSAGNVFGGPATAGACVIHGPGPGPTTPIKPGPNHKNTGLVVGQGNILGMASKVSAGEIEVEEDAPFPYKIGYKVVNDQSFLDAVEIEADETK